MEEFTGPPEGAPQDPPAPDSGPFTQKFQHTPVAARVPDKISRGVMSSGVIVLDSPNEFVLDYLQNLTRPNQIVARVVLAPPMMDQLISTLQENINKFTQTHGPIPTLPKPPANRPTLQEIYEHFKLPDELLSGAYANNVMIGHSASEFFVDFITGFYPTAAVSSRILMAAPQTARMLDTLKLALAQYRKRFENPEP